MALSPEERLAAYLVAPKDVSPPSPEELPDPERFLEYTVAEKLPLEETIRLNGLGEDPLVQSEELRPVLEADRQRRRMIHDEYKSLQVKLLEAGIAHVLIKAIYGVPYWSDNIDILIREDDFGRVGDFLEDLRYIHFSSYTDRSKDLYKLIEGSRLTGMFHLHRRVAWYSHFIEPDIIFAGARGGEEPDIRVPDPEVSLCVNGCHALYEDASVKFIDLYKIRCLVTGGQLDWDRVWQIAEHRGFTSGLALALLILDRQNRTYAGRPLFDDSELARMESYLSRVDGTKGHYRRRVQGRQLTCPYVMSKYFVRRCLFRQLKRARIMGLWTKTRLACRILRHGFMQVTGWRPQRSMLVAVCGADGCGKSTQVDLLANLLEDLEIRTLRSWCRIGDSPLLNLLKGPLRQRVRAEVDTDGRMTSERGVFRSRFVRTVWPIVAVSDYLLRQYAMYIWTVLHERMIIADRYHVDALVDLALRCGPEVMRKRWVLAAMRMLPKARTAFVLKVTDETMRRRRAEDYVEGLTHRVIEYYDEAARLMDVPVLEGDQEPEALAETIVKATLPRFFERA